MAESVSSDDGMAALCHGASFKKRDAAFPPCFLAPALTPRLRILLAGGAVLAVGVALFASCGGCGHHADGKGATTATPTADGGTSAVDAGPIRAASLLWESAKSYEVEDLATLAVQEGAAGLIEAAGDPDLRPVAIRAMAYARGYAQMGFLARTALGKDDVEAGLALDAALDVAARPRRQEDPEDADELKEGCDGLGGLAKDTARPKARRIAAIRVLRMLPCPKADVPTDLDAK